VRIDRGGAGRRILGVGIVNAVIRPVLVIIPLPVTILTLGLLLRRE
jgi:uncharacterized membrane protein YvlD (DUF360 family)